MRLVDRGEGGAVTVYGCRGSEVLSGGKAAVRKMRRGCRRTAQTARPAVRARTSTIVDGSEVKPKPELRHLRNKMSGRV
ncbi:MAG: hypothetical protein JWR32_4174 [Mycobacterium sp.]|nr:hypothetical protein [Mycobacterium sp.]